MLKFRLNFFFSISIAEVEIFSFSGNVLLKLRYFETLKPSDIHSRVRRSPDPNPSSHLHEFWFSSFGRYIVLNGGCYGV